MSITGAALYGLLMLTNHFLPQEKPEFTISANDHAAGANSHPTFLGEQPSCISC